MKVTKRPKRVTIIREQVVSERSSYGCPACRAYFIGAGIGRNIKRFRCSCGQELIVDSFDESSLLGGDK